VLIAGVAAVSLAAIFIRLAQAQDVSSLVIACGRLLIAALLLSPAVLRRSDYVDQVRRLTPSERILALVAGVFLALHFATWVTSLEYTTVLISVVLVTTTPIWVALLEVVFLRARLSPLIITGLIVALIGGIVIGLSGEATADVSTSDRIRGAILSLIGAMAVAVYLVIGRRLRRTLALTPYIWLVYGIAALIMCGLLLASDTPVTGYSAEGYLWVALTALVPQLVGHSSLNYALAYLPATYVSLSTQMEPVLSALVAVVVFQEIPGWLQVGGGLIIMTGVLLASISPRKASTEPASG
jgi:drug/metabolite transporter (DMT)-like permease